MDYVELYQHQSHRPRSKASMKRETVYFVFVDSKKKRGYKRYTHTGEVDVNYQLVELLVQKKPGESQVETIKNIDKIVSQLAKENNVVPTFAKVSFR